MREILILRLHGVMQAWGGHTFEDYRPSLLFPTRSGLVGIIGACLGIDRGDQKALQALTSSFLYCARLDESPYAVRKIIDFHTVLDARKVDGKRNPNPVVSRREYLCDARFTIALQTLDGSSYTLEQISSALREPVYTPFLGRRSCPPARPLLECILEAEDLHSALAEIPPARGILYSELDVGGKSKMIVRDVPAGRRLFATRPVYLYVQEEEDVHQPA